MLCPVERDLDLRGRLGAALELDKNEPVTRWGQPQFMAGAVEVTNAPPTFSRTTCGGPARKLSPGAT